MGRRQRGPDYNGVSGPATILHRGNVALDPHRQAERHYQFTPHMSTTPTRCGAVLVDNWGQRVNVVTGPTVRNFYELDTGEGKFLLGNRS